MSKASSVVLNISITLDGQHVDSNAHPSLPSPHVTELTELTADRADELREEANGGPIRRVSASTLRTVCLHSGGETIQHAWRKAYDSTESTVADLSDDEGELERAIETAREDEQDALDEALELVERLRRLLNRWIERGHRAYEEGKGEHTYEDLNGAAQTCFDTIVWANSRGGLPHLSVPHAIDQIAQMTLGPTQGSRLHKTIYSINDDIVSCYHSVIESICFARELDRPRKKTGPKEARAYTLNIEPLDYSDIIDASGDLICALAREGIRETAKTYKQKAKLLSREDVISIVRALRDKEKLKELREHIRKHVIINTVNGHDVVPPFTYCDDTIKALGELVGIDPVKKFG